MPRIAILGAGPIGIEAAVLAHRSGMDVQVYEQEDIAANVQQWGHVTLFTPWSMNTSAWGRGRLQQAGMPLPQSDVCPTGAEFVTQYLQPLASSLPPGTIHTRHRMEGLGRDGLLKSDAIGKPERVMRPFRLLLNEAGIERIATADYVLDCTGTYGTPNAIGAGGLPCVGERQAADAIHYHLPDIASRRADFAEKTTLVVGNGYSAATAVAALAELARSAPRTRVEWRTRRVADAPLVSIPDDVLPGRAALTTTANRLASARSSAVHWRGGWMVEQIEQRPGNSPVGWTVKLRSSSDGDECETLNVDHILALVGYRPDRHLYEELQVHECYASQGPMKLAAALLGSTSADCLVQPAQGIGVLRNPEPRFFILGAKGYGRSARFLLQTGIEQVTTVVRDICQEQHLQFPDDVVSVKLSGDAS